MVTGAVSSSSTMPVGRANNSYDLWLSLEQSCAVLGRDLHGEPPWHFTLRVSAANVTRKLQRTATKIGLRGLGWLSAVRCPAFVTAGPVGHRTAGVVWTSDSRQRGLCLSPTLRQYQRLSACYPYLWCNSCMKNICPESRMRVHWGWPSQDRRDARHVIPKII